MCMTGQLCREYCGNARLLTYGDRQIERQAEEYRSCRGVCTIAAGRALSRVSLEASHAPMLAVEKHSQLCSIACVYSFARESLFACVKLEGLDRATCGVSVSCNNRHKCTILRLRLTCNTLYDSRGSWSLPHNIAVRNPNLYASSRVRSLAVKNLGVNMAASAMAAPTPSEPTEDQRTNARGQKLFTLTYRASGEQRAVLFHHHGYGEHVGRMRHCELPDI
jgi:hypothetical protein